MSMAQAGFERLLVLERGLRSGLRTEQQKALDSIPSYLEEFKASPEVIESCIIKIVDFFKARSMERKVDIIGYLESISCHFNTIKCNGEEIVRRLNFMWEINDSLLRTLILRWYSLLHGPCLSGRIEVWYRVGRSLLSEVREEYEQAMETAIIFACPQFCNSVADQALARIEKLPLDSVLGQRLLKAMLLVDRFTEVNLVYILAKSRQPDECEFQSFLEKNQSILPL